jgi:hypothetical protein
MITEVSIDEDDDGDLQFLRIRQSIQFRQSSQAGWTVPHPATIDYPTLLRMQDSQRDLVGGQVNSFVDHNCSRVDMCWHIPPGHS